MPNWIGAGWLGGAVYGGPNLASLTDYENVLKPAITIVALGSNDARIITASPSQYSSDDNFWKVLDIVNRARAQSNCVLLTTVADHWSAASSASVNAVNGNIHWADLNMSGVYVATGTATPPATPTGSNRRTTSITRTSGNSSTRPTSGT